MSISKYRRTLSIFYGIIFSGQYYISCIASHEKSLGLKQREVIANMRRYDGFGAHMLEIITAVIYAELHDREFCYRPFDAMEHNYDNDPDFLAKKEKLLNFFDYFETFDEAVQKNYTIVSEFYVPFFDENVEKCANSRPLKKIKKIFRANKNTKNYFKNKNFNIAVHIRRPNPHDNRIYGTDIPDDFYAEIINKLRAKYSSRNPLFHIYSQGDIENFDMYHAPDVILHLNESVEDTYLPLVLADVLVTGRSSFSYTAGYLSDGIVYYNSYMHAALPHWTPVEKLLAE